MNRDLVSIIIPCYRQAHFLPAAVECALAQSYGAVEVIVVNDGSDDGTEEAASRYGERITYVAKQNGGLPSARNAGIRQSHGEWLFFLDADDLIHPDAITWLVKAAAGRNGCVAQMGWRRFASDPQEEPFSDQVPPEIVEPLPRLLHENLGPVHSFLSPRKMVLDAGAFQETLRGVEDWDLWTRLALAGAQFTAVRRVGAYYRQTPGSMVRQRDVMVQARIEILLRAHREILPRGERLAALGHDLVQLEHAYLRAASHAGSPIPWCRNWLRRCAN